MRRPALFCMIFCGLIPAAAQVHPVGIRVREDFMRTIREKRVDPAYPEAALKAGIGGLVELQIRISKAGDVQTVQLISGNPDLGVPGVEAVKKWRYKPYLLNGIPIEVTTKVTLSYEFSSGEGVVRDAPVHTIPAHYYRSIP